MLRESSSAPRIETPTLNGGAATIGEGPALYAFFHITCPVCQMTLPYLDKLAGPLRVVGVSQDDAEGTNEFADSFGIANMELALDDERKKYPASRAYRISSVPSLFVVEADGTISKSWTGFSKAEIEALGSRVGVQVFGPNERVPNFRPG